MISQFDEKQMKAIVDQKIDELKKLGLIQKILRYPLILKILMI